MNGKSCTIVLVGSQTAERDWVKYEIKRSWELGKALLGIRIHGLKDNAGNISTNGKNPFDCFSIKGKSLTDIVKCRDPAGYSSQDKYNTIATNISSWIEEAIRIRSNH